jgi:hypothetical protein
MSMCLPGIPQIDDLALDADRWLRAPVTHDDRAIEDDVRESAVLSPLQCLVQVRGLPG